MIENKKHIHWMAMLGLVVIIGLQGVWLHNTYQLVKKDITEICLKVLDESMIIEFNEKLSSGIGDIELGDSIQIGTECVTHFTPYIYEAVFQHKGSLNSQVLQDVDTIFKQQIKLYPVAYTHFSLSLIQAADSANMSKAGWGSIVADLPIKTDRSQYVRLILYTPWDFLSRMGLLLAATAVMMLFVIFCIVWQVKILRRMSRVLRIREDFSYAMVHDMKTPLSSIIMTLRPLHQGRLDDKPQLRERYFSIAEAEAQHLLALTNKILTLSKLENHRLHLVPEPLPLRPVVEKLAESLAPKCPKPLRISYDLQVETLYADPEFWPEVMQNLLDNAVKYTRPDAEAVEIRISTRPAGRHTTELRIRDNGRGISRRHLRTIFDKYERASAERGRQQDSAPAGFGLGLSFVHQVVRAHGGTIRAESEEGKWTEFVILMKNEESRTKNPGKEEDEEKERNIEYSGKDMEVSVKKSEQGKQVRVKIGNLWKGKGLEINIENSEKGKSVTINRTTKNEENA